MANPITWAANRISEWWIRTSWGWLVIIGPILTYLVTWIALDIVGLSASNPIQFDAGTFVGQFRTGDELTLYSVRGRLEYALVAVLLLLTALFSIIWSLPRVLAAIRNPFGGLTGLIIAGGLSAALYWLYWISDYELRQIFADDILRFGEQLGALDPIAVQVGLMGQVFYSTEMPQSQVLAYTRDVVYFFGNAAPWFLIVLAARCAAFEPRSYRTEPPTSLRNRMMVLQIAVILAAANIVLSVAYTRAMTNWPPKLLVDELAADFDVASTRYVALWGALGTLLLISALAPAYVSLNRQFDRVANNELSEKLGRAPTYRERLDWRLTHGLVVSAQQVLTTGAAVIAPLVTSPALDASGVGRDEKPRAGISIDQNAR